MANNLNPLTGSDDEMKRLRSIILVADRTLSARNKEIRDINQELQDKNRKLEAFADKVKDHVLCPICFEEFTTPVVIICCGQTLCEECLLNSMQSMGGNSSLVMVFVNVIIVRCVIVALICHTLKMLL